MKTRNLSQLGLTESAAPLFDEVITETACLMTNKGADRQQVESNPEAARTSSVPQSNSIAYAVDAIEILSALLANGNACQNWLSSAHPNLERARLSVTRIVRDAQELSNVMRQVRSVPTD